MYGMSASPRGQRARAARTSRRGPLPMNDTQQDAARFLQNCERLKMAERRKVLPGQDKNLGRP